MHLTAVEETTGPQLDEMLEVNLTAAFLLVRELMPALRAGIGGSVLLTSSRAGISGFANEAVYCATKFGDRGPREGARRGVRRRRDPGQHDHAGGGRIKPTGLSRADEAALPAEKRGWGSSEALGPAFAAFALLPGFAGAPNGRRFEADRVAGAVRTRGLPLPADAWAGLAA